MRQFHKGIIDLKCKVGSKEGLMLIFTISLDPEAEPGPILFPDPAALEQIISDPGGSGSTHCL